MDCGGTCAKCQAEKAAAKSMEPPAGPDEKRYVHEDQLQQRRAQEQRARERLRRPVTRAAPPRRPVLGARGRR